MAAYGTPEGAEANHPVTLAASAVVTSDGCKAGRTLPVSIIIPAFGAAMQLEACLTSLCQHAPPGCTILVADDATPDDSVLRVASAFQSKLSISYVRRTRNLGFVENCNEAIEAILPSGNDILLLNSDTQVTHGFLEEMWEVLHLHEKHAAVSPRSNKATIVSVPVWGGLAAADSYELWTAISALLPRFQVIPTAVGFCLLIKNVVVRQLGVFDAAYSPGYNEENDFICRINRHGYSAIVANHAFVFHHESSSFGQRRNALEERNARLLSERYPEYLPKVDEYLRYGVDPIDHFAPLWREHRPRILYDLFHLPAKHSGTSEFALSLLVHLAPVLEARYDVILGLSDEGREFFSSELAGYELFDEARETDARFDLVFKPCQVFTWSELRRMIRLGGRVAFTHLDIIAVRCDYLSSANTRAIVKTAARLADRVMTISEFSRQDFEMFYNLPLPFEVIYLGTDAHSDRSAGSQRRVLVVGNQFHHKAVNQAALELADVADVTALGGRPVRGPVRWLESGGLSRSAIADLYDSARVVVYPSYYEGFGMPIVDAAARGIPVVALDTAVNREVAAMVPNDRLFLVKDHSELRAVVSKLVDEPLTASTPPAVRSWRDVAIEYARSFDDLLGRELDIDLIRRRWELVATIDVMHPLK